MKSHELFIIEPDPDIANSLQELFELEGYGVTLCSNLDVLLTRTNFQKYDMVIADTDSNCDFNFELAQRRKNRDIDTKLFVIACYCVIDREHLLIRKGLDGVLAKPLDFDILLKQVSDLLIESTTT
ncbi:MAG: response regulator [Balneolales bacterium]|nr:response regulator [Balneolales bacterium]